VTVGMEQVVSVETESVVWVEKFQLPAGLPPVKQDGEVLAKQQALILCPIADK